MTSKAARGRTQDRIEAAIGVAILHALLGYALVTALGMEIPARVSDDLKLFEIEPEPHPPPAEKPNPPPPASKSPPGEASPPNLKAKPSEVMAPPAEVPLVQPPPVVSAPIAGVGNDRSAGAADVPGPGTGSGGQGTGTGSGGDGDDEGSEYSPPRWLRGRLKHSDYPREAGEVGLGRTIVLQFTVNINGQATQCAVLESSGNELLDDATCRAIERRYRYEPSRDAHGTAVPSAVVESHTWEIDQR